MKNFKILKPQPSPKNGRDPLANLSNFFVARPKSNSNKSPNHSPNNSNRSRFATQVSNASRQQKKPSYSKLQIQSKYAPTSLKCINHKDKNGKFKIDNDSSCYLYCQTCAIQLNQKGKRLISLKSDDKNIKMIHQSKKYLQQCQQILAILTYKIGELRVQRFKVDSKYSKIIDDIIQQKEKTILKINMQYQQQIKQHQEYKKKYLVRIQEQEDRLRSFQKQFQVSKNDIVQNIKETNLFIDLSDFREVMDYYWKNIQNFTEMINKKYPLLTITTNNNHNDSFTHKPRNNPNHHYHNQSKQNIYSFVPRKYKQNIVDNNNSGMLQQSILYETNMRLLDNPPFGREFTFSKNLFNFDNKGKEAFSIQLSSNRQKNSSESIVEEKILIH